MLTKDLNWMLNLSATGAGKIATEERLEHQDKRKVLPSFKALKHQVLSNFKSLL